MLADRRLLFLVAASLALLPAGCGDDFLPPSLLTNLRVLAVEASPLEAGPADQVQLRPILYLPPGERLERERWSFCPFTLGASSSYRCALPECETTLAVAADGSVEAAPFALATTCAARLLSSASLPGGVLPGGTLPAELETVFRATHRSSSGLERETALRFPLWLTAPPPARNRPPAVRQISLDGEPLVQGTPARPAPAGAELELRVELDPASLDSFVDEAGRQRTEEPIVSFFSSAGRFSQNLEAGTEVTVRLKLEELLPDDREAQIYVVVRDGRGGQRAAGPFLLPLQR